MEKQKKYSTACFWEFLALGLITGLFAWLVYYTQTTLHPLLLHDAIPHTLASFRIFECLKFGDLLKLFYGDDFYPPLVYWVSSIFYCCFPLKIITVIMSQLPFWAVLIFSIYGTGKLLFSRLTGFLAVFFFLTMPLTLYWSNSYMLDIPCAAMASLVFYLLLKTQDFKNAFYSGCFGLALGLAMLARSWMPALFFGAILLYYVKTYFGYIRGFWFRVGGMLIPGAALYFNYLLCGKFGNFGELAFWPCGLISLSALLVIWLTMFWLIHRAGKSGGLVPALRTPWLNLASALSLCYLLTAWWYFNPDFSLSSGRILFDSVAVADLWANLDAYPRMVYIDILGPVYTLLLAVGLVVFGFKFRENAGSRLLMWNLLFFTLVFCLVGNKNSYYLFPWLALAAPLAVFWFDYLRKFKWLPVLGLLFIGFSYIACGLFLPPAYFPAHGMLKEIREAAEVYHEKFPDFADDLYRALFAGLPPGAKVTWFCVTVPIGDNVIEVYPALSRGGVLHPPSGDLKYFDYLVYSYDLKLGEKAYLTRMRLELADLFDDRKFQFPVLASYQVPGYPIVFRLARIVEQKNR